MKAMVLQRISSIELSPLKWMDCPDPDPQPGEVRLKVRCCAICRTDLHVIEGDLPSQILPLIPGHQVVGTIDKLGPGCTRLKIDMRIGVAWLRHTCGVCRFCMTERENLCEFSRYTGYHADGGYAEYTVVPEAFAYEIPSRFSDIDAAPLLCAGIIGYRSLQRSLLPVRGKLLMVGFGSSAHIVMQLAKHRGSEVYVVTRDNKHIQLARQMGATWAGSSMKQLPVKVDSAILFAPAGNLVPPMLAALDKGGALAIAGIHLTDIPTMNYQIHLFFEKQLRSVSSNTRQDGRNLLEEAAAIPILPHVRVYPLQEANQALQDLKADRISGTGVLVVDQ